MRFFYWLENMVTGEVRRCLSDNFSNACRLAGWNESRCMVISLTRIPEANYLLKEVFNSLSGVEVVMNRKRNHLKG